MTGSHGSGKSSAVKHLFDNINHKGTVYICCDEHNTIDMLNMGLAKKLKLWHLSTKNHYMKTLILSSLTSTFFLDMPSSDGSNFSAIKECFERLSIHYKAVNNGSI